MRGRGKPFAHESLDERRDRCALEVRERCKASSRK
jgi:hypothetical protein